MSQPPYPLQTPRLLLRMLREEDIDVLTAYRNDPEVNALQDWDLPYPRERAERMVAELADRADIVPGKGTQLAIDLDGELIGDLYVGLDEHSGIADIGYTLRTEHQGKGYAGEATAAVVDDLIGRLGVHRVVAELSTDNTASARLLERLGMTFESLTRRSFWWRGAWDDNLYYSMSAEERRAWLDRPQGPPEQVRLVELTHENAGTYQQLRTHRTQEQFVATMEQSYAHALFPEPEGEHPVLPVLRGIEADGEPVGFLMWADAINEGTPDPYLWRYLIDRRHQGRGIGSRALELWIEGLRADGHTTVETSWVPGHGSPEQFYRKAGFVPTGEMDGDEVVAQRAI